MTVLCSNCLTSIEGLHFNTETYDPCRSCGASLRVDVFPSLFKKTPVGQAGEWSLEERESSCFYHPRKKATVVCRGCGRFLCTLCDIELNDRHLCPACVERGRKKGKMTQLENHRTLYDSVALYLAILPVFFIFITCITAPAVLYVVVRYWNAPGSIVPRTKIRFLIAAVIALAQIGVWGFLIFIWIS